MDPYVLKIFPELNREKTLKESHFSEKGMRDPPSRQKADWLILKNLLIP